MVDVACKSQIVRGYISQSVEVRYAYCTHANLCVLASLHMQLFA